MCIRDRCEPVHSMHGLSEAEQREQSAVQPSTAYMNSLFECILECKVQQSAEKQVQCDRAQFECEVALREVWPTRWAQVLQCQEISSAKCTRSTA